MEFNEKYTTDAVKEPDKIPLSKDAYAISEMINQLRAEIFEFAKRMKK